MRKPNYNDAVHNLVNNKVLHGRSHGPIAKIVLEDGVIPPTEDAIQTELTKLISVWDAQEYARNRAVAFPSIPDQLDEIYHNGIDSWKAVIKVTKDKYPKG